MSHYWLAAIASDHVWILCGVCVQGSSMGGVQIGLGAAVTRFKRVRPEAPLCQRAFWPGFLNNPGPSHQSGLAPSVLCPCSSFACLRRICFPISRQAMSWALHQPPAKVWLGAGKVCFANACQAMACVLHWP